MKLTPGQMQALAHKVMDHWKKANLVTFKVDEAKVLTKIIDVMKAEIQKEMDLDREVNTMLDQLERTNSGEFQRYKMYPILKQKLAKERKVIL
jgi:hypothetical protein